MPTNSKTNNKTKTKKENKSKNVTATQSATQNKIDKNDLRKTALKKAWEIRNYEINLYWHRAAYFWAFNTSLACACYQLYKHKADFSALIIAGCLLLGLACSIAWILSNIASKRWQENWENHINILEDKVNGRLYKTTISNYEHQPKPSVSRLNLKISCFVFVLWFTFCIGYAKELTSCLEIVIYTGALITVLKVMLLCEVDIPEIKTVWKLIFGEKDKDLFMQNYRIEDKKIINVYD